MAVRQYIGARYTIKVYENSLDPSSADWEIGVSYEPITLVQYHNDTYLSKKFVPSNVGDPANNPDYWTLTGFYNGQIANLQNQINAIYNIAEKNIICIGDSYVNKYPDTSGKTMWEYLADCGGWDATKLQGRVGASGSGFLRNTGAGTFLDNITNIASGMSNDDKASIGVVLVEGGGNDWPYTRLEILTAIYDFTDYCKQTFPNCEVMLAYAPNYKQDHTNTYGTRDEQHKMFLAFQDCQAHGAIFLAGVECALKDSRFMAVDWIHPNASGRKALAERIYQALMCGSAYYSKDYIDVPITFESFVSGAYNSVAKIRERMINNNLIISGGEGKTSGALMFNYGDFTYTGGIKDVKIGELPHATSGFINYPLIDTNLAVDDAIIRFYEDSNTVGDTYYFGGCKMYINSDGEVRLSIYMPAVTPPTTSIGQIQFLKTSDVVIPAAIC